MGWTSSWDVSDTITTGKLLGKSPYERARRL
jgi:hypothetical protein